MARPAKPWYRTAEDCWFVTHNGKKVNLFVRGRRNEADAWRAYDQLRSGPNPTPAPTPPPAPQPQPKPVVTVAEVVRVFLNDAQGRVEPATYELYDLFLNNFCERFGATPASDLTSPQAEAYSRKKEWGQSTRSAFLAVLLRAFRFAERSRIIDRNPISDLKRPAISSRAADVLLTAEQHQQLCEVAPAPFRTFLQFIWLTGCRPNEAAQLTADDVDLEAGTATIRKHKTAKAGKRRTLYLPPEAVALLRLLIDHHRTGPLLRNRIGQQWTKATWGAAMRTARKTAGLKGKKIVYGLRHSFATDALANGVPDAQVAELLGHSNTTMLHRHYSHLSTKAKVLTEAVRKVR